MRKRQNNRQSQQRIRCRAIAPERRCTKSWVESRDDGTEGEEQEQEEARVSDWRVAEERVVDGGEGGGIHEEGDAEVVELHAQGRDGGEWGQRVWHLRIGGWYGGCGNGMYLAQQAKHMETPMQYVEMRKSSIDDADGYLEKIEK
ncbi:MAG: hypothetical protein M1822_002558 [Bathelium mastoideum]|nr:MAG: hypothetical protein M1822_002558 [Bathelium mastoideum]